MKRYAYKGEIVDAHRTWGLESEACFNGKGGVSRSEDWWVRYQEDENGPEGMRSYPVPEWDVPEEVILRLRTKARASQQAEWAFDKEEEAEMRRGPRMRGSGRTVLAWL